MTKFLLPSYLALLLCNASALLITATSEGIVLASSIAGSGVTNNFESIDYSGETFQANTFSNAISSENGVTIYDANNLEFEFTSSTKNFIFAPKRYCENLNYPNSFGLFVDVINIALASDRSTMSVRTTCDPAGTGLGPNCSSYNDNASGSFDIKYDEFTDFFTAGILGLSAVHIH